MDVLKILDLLEDIGKEPREAGTPDPEKLARDADAEHDRVMSVEDLTEDQFGYRYRLHRDDMRNGGGVFQEAMNEIAYADHDLYKLMLANPTEFGMEMARRFHAYANSVARSAY